jgi:hypothetical protein
VLPQPWSWHGAAEEFSAAALAKGLSGTAKGRDGFGLSLPLTAVEEEINLAAVGLKRALAARPELC